MTNQKLCDICDKNVIPRGDDYVKLVLVKHEGTMQKYLGVGHMCLSCWEAQK